MMKIDDFVARLEKAPAFQAGAVLCIRVEEMPDPAELRELTRRLRDHCGVELLVTLGDLEVEELPQPSDREVFEVLSALRRQASIQDQVAKLKEKFVLVSREKLAGV
jgi:hypothetical protein